jgi:membrane-associated phospholipid phosphatase
VTTRLPPAETLQPQADLSTLKYVTLLLGAVAAILAAISSGSGRSVGFAWPIILRVLLVALPLAAGIYEIGRLLGRSLSRMRHAQAIFVAAGLTLLAAATPGQLPPALMVGLIAVLIVRVLTLRRAARHALGLSALAIALLLVSVALMNNLLLPLAGDRLIDPQLRWSDEIVYSHVLGIRSYVGIFPLIRIGTAFTVIENAYLSGGFLLMLVPMVLTYEPRQIALFLASALLCYALAGLVFVAMPAIGPVLYFPDALDPRFKSTLTNAMTEMLRLEATRIRSGQSPATGLGYFIALPSLHAALATVCQYHLRTSAPWFWMMLPVTVMLVLSTVVLGQHYVVDALAGVALGAGVSEMVTYAASRRDQTSR